MKRKKTQKLLSLNVKFRQFVINEKPSPGFPTMTLWEADANKAGTGTGMTLMQALNNSLALWHGDPDKHRLIGTYITGHAGSDELKSRWEVRSRRSWRTLFRRVFFLVMVDFFQGNRCDRKDVMTDFSTYDKQSAHYQCEWLNKNGIASHQLYEGASLA